jgi:hypothetical protein
MKKVLYIIALVASIAVSLSSCTEEVVKPKDDNASGSSTSSSPKGN